MMNTFDNQSNHLEGYENPGSQAPPDTISPQEGNPPDMLPPQEDESLPVLLRPAGRRAEAFLPEWLRRLARG